MCGIVGYIGPKNATPIILNGLKRLEYRGYDSAGIAVLTNGHIEVRRDAGKLENLVAMVSADPISGRMGIGHTRWATHGEPTARNAHPHLSGDNDFVVVHNGIVENFLELKDELNAEGVTFRSDTDTETIVHLVERYYTSGKDVVKAARSALLDLKGAHGVVLMSSHEPDKIIAARIGNAGGVVIGVGEGEMYVASDIPAILEHTRRVIFLESGQMAVITRDGAAVSSLDGAAVTPQVHTVAWDPVAAEKGEYRHFMQKEIHEQVRSLTDTLAGRVDSGQWAHSSAQPFPRRCSGKADPEDRHHRLRDSISCRHGRENSVGAHRTDFQRRWISPPNFAIAIRSWMRTRWCFRSANPARRPIPWRRWKRDVKKAALLWSIVNAIGSQAMRLADGCISMQSGPEIGVASTKAFTAPLVDLYLLAVLLGDLRGVLSERNAGGWWRI